MFLEWPQVDWKWCRSGPEFIRNGVEVTEGPKVYRKCTEVAGLEMVLKWPKLDWKCWMNCQNLPGVNRNGSEVTLNYAEVAGRWRDIVRKWPKVDIKSFGSWLKLPGCGVEVNLNDVEVAWRLTDILWKWPEVDRKLPKLTEVSWM